MVKTVSSLNSVDKLSHGTVSESSSRAQGQCPQRVLRELRDYLSITPHNEADGLTEAYLLRCLEATEHSIPKTVQLLRQRRVFEQTFPTIRLTPQVLTALRSGAISTIGRDLQGRLVLYIHPKYFKQDPLDEQETQRLFVIVMEYALGCCTANQAPQQVLTTESPRVVHTDRRTSASEVQNQQIVVLVNEEGSSWHSSNMALSRAKSLLALLTKYYPRLVVQILLYQPSCDVKLLVKHVLPSGPAASGALTAVEVVTPNHIQKYISPTTLPEELGGTSNFVSSSSSSAFADAVLRHWFLETSYLLTEDASSRPIWKLPPCTVAAAGWSNLLARASAAAVAKSGTTNYVAITDGNEGADYHVDPLSGEVNREQLHARVDNWVQESHVMYSRCRGQIRCSSAEAENDDGGGSILSDVHFLSCREAELSTSDVWLGVDGFNSAAEREALLRELQNERNRRFAMEKQLLNSRTSLGTTTQLDAQVTEKIEEALKTARVSLNMLVMNVVACAQESEACGNPPTLRQLLDLTLTTIEGGTSEVQKVSNMKSPKLVKKKKEDKSSCCTVM
ncbi:CRAL/TRIO domain containing protein [Trypanosoma brucei equiperdum]|uniref:CRAL/TRIO domain containing protein n=1 Tax=Trypanosoma brucei equiperdum TaxID=630700 RepID=A0A3L6L6G3_9TRYP|nr:CRAL/TRIO domain containing protein [Trypanosoma brucei equiperdum]